MSEAVNDVVAYIGLGSNLDGPERQVREALVALNAVKRTRLLRVSRLYRTPPWGYNDQPAFVNAVAEVVTELMPTELLAELVMLEKQGGRERNGTRWGPRVIDLDLLLYGHMHLCTRGLELPHPRMAKRAFVLVPLADLVPEYEILGQGVVRELLAALDTHTCVPLT